MQAHRYAHNYNTHSMHTHTQGSNSWLHTYIQFIYKTIYTKVINSKRGKENSLCFELAIIHRSFIMIPLGCENANLDKSKFERCHVGAGLIYFT